MEEEYGKIEGEIEDVGLDVVTGDDHTNGDDADIYIMMQCLFVCL